MSSLDDRPADKLFDMILNVTWQDLLQVFESLKKKIDSDGPDAIQEAYKTSRTRFLDGPFQDHIEVRWGMNLCLHCNDDNIEKNGILYVQPSGDGLEFNQCLNCRIGILYHLKIAQATMDSYLIALGEPKSYNGMDVFWVGIPAAGMNKFQPLYEIVNPEGAWTGSFSFDEELTPKFLPGSAMTEGTPRDAEEPWTTEIPTDVSDAIAAFVSIAKHQIEVAHVLRGI